MPETAPSPTMHCLSPQDRRFLGQERQSDHYASWQAYKGWEAAPSPAPQVVVSKCTAQESNTDCNTRNGPKGSISTTL